MLFDLILKSPDFANNAFSFFTTYILLPFIGVASGFALTIFLYGYVKKVHLGEYYTKGEEEGGELMGKGLMMLGICGLVFIMSYYFLS